MSETMPEFDGSFPEDACGRDTHPEAERVYRELWERKPLAWRITRQRRHWEWVQSIGRAGLDVTMLQANLDRTVTERIRLHGIALNLMQWLRKAVRKNR